MHQKLLLLSARPIWPFSRKWFLLQFCLSHFSDRFFAAIPGTKGVFCFQFFVIVRNTLAVYKRDKPHLNIGTIGHVDHGKTTLTSAITRGWLFGTCLLYILQYPFKKFSSFTQITSYHVAEWAPKTCFYPKFWRKKFWKGSFPYGLRVTF